jgi:hypothetical protein
MVIEFLLYPRSPLFLQRRAKFPEGIGKTNTYEGDLHINSPSSKPKFEKPM